MAGGAVETLLGLGMLSCLNERIGRDEERVDLVGWRDALGGRDGVCQRHSPCEVAAT